MAKSTGKGAKRQHKERSSRQWGRTYKNKEKAWSHHLKKNPNDVWAKTSIEKARKTIKTF
jgi:hypothetical protein